MRYRVYTGSRRSAEEVIKWAGVTEPWYHDERSGVLKVSNCVGEIHAQPGSMILLGNGEFYPCRMDVCLKLFGGDK